MTRTILALVAAVLAAVGSASAETRTFAPAHGYQTYAVREPVLRVKPGDVLETNTLFCECYTQKGGRWPGDAGPIYVEGATTGDTLVAKIVRLRPKIDTGESSTGGRSYGVLTPTNDTPMLTDPVPTRRFIWKIDTARMTASLDLPASRMKHIEVAAVARIANVVDPNFAVMAKFPKKYLPRRDAARH